MTGHAGDYRGGDCEGEEGEGGALRGEGRAAAEVWVSAGLFSSDITFGRTGCGGLPQFGKPFPDGLARNFITVEHGRGGSAVTLALIVQLWIA